MSANVSAEIKVGDVVKLKSDGPKMTVDSFAFGSDDLVRCCWFVGSSLQDAPFDKGSLVLQKDKE